MLDELVGQAELQHRQAQARGIPALMYAEALGKCMLGRTAIAVAGAVVGYKGTKKLPEKLFFRLVEVALFVISLFVNLGMWMERFVIIVTGLEHDLLPSSWGSYWPSYVEVLTLVGSFGLFLTLFMLFIRFLPMISVFEMRDLVVRVRGRRAMREAVAE